MPRGGYQGGKPPTKSATGLRAQMTSFRLTPESRVQLEATATSLGCSRTTLVERLIAQSTTASSVTSPASEVDFLRTALAASQQGRQRLSAELMAATERELGYQAEIEDLKTRIASLANRGATWAHGVLHLETEATVQDVLKSFRDLSKRFHPDRNRHEPAVNRYFQNIVKAKQLLIHES